MHARVCARRRDVFAQRRLGVPHTWSEAMHAASLLNGTDMNGDGEPDWGFCIEPDLGGCRQVVFGPGASLRAAGYRCQCTS